MKQNIMTALGFVCVILMGCGIAEAEPTPLDTGYSYDFDYVRDNPVTKAQADQAWETVEDYIRSNDVDWSQEPFHSHYLQLRYLHECGVGTDAYYKVLLKHGQVYDEAVELKEAHDARLEAERILAEQEAERQRQAELMEAVYEEPEPVYSEPSGYYEPEASGAAVDSGEVDAGYLRKMGRVNSDGKEFTWYSQRVLPGGGLTALNGNGRTVRDDGLVTDGDGYVSIAAPVGSGASIGDTVDTPWGEAKVYDYNEGSAWDIYTDF